MKIYLEKKFFLLLIAMNLKKYNFFCRNVKIQRITTIKSLLQRALWNHYLFFTEDINVNEILNYCANNLLRKCRKAVGNKWDYWNTCIILSITFHEIALSYKSQLKPHLIYFGILGDHNLGLSRVLSSLCNFTNYVSVYADILKNIVKDCHLRNRSLNYDVRY